VCEQFNENRECDTEKCYFFNDHFVPAENVVEVVRCKDCIYAVELDKHCDISRTAYRHCSLLRGDETQYVWHKYKKYYKDYSIVDLDGYCDSGELKEREKV
jgi:hypothetical protein